VPNACTICDLEQKTRKVAEAMLRESIGVRDVADFINWKLAKDVVEGQTPTTVTKSAVDRHKQAPHFVLEPERTIPQGTGKYTTVEDIAMELVRRYGALLENPNWIPMDKDVREWAALMGKLEDLEQRRRDEAQLKTLLAGAAFAPKRPVVVDTTATAARGDHTQLPTGETT
jgi:hypothetical protein